MFALPPNTLTPSPCQRHHNILTDAGGVGKGQRLRSTRLAHPLNHRRGSGGWKSGQHVDAMRCHFIAQGFAKGAQPGFGSRIEAHIRERNPTCRAADQDDRAPLGNQVGQSQARKLDGRCEIGGNRIGDLVARSFRERARRQQPRIVDQKVNRPQLISGCGPRLHRDPSPPSDRQAGQRPCPPSAQSPPPSLPAATVAAPPSHLHTASRQRQGDPTPNAAATAGHQRDPPRQRTILALFSTGFLTGTLHGK